MDYNLNILFGKNYLKNLFKKSDISICVSESIKQYFELKKSYVIYNGVLPMTDCEILFDKDDYFLFAGSLFPEKGIYQLLKAYVEFSKINLTTSLNICGTGNDENINRIKRIINQAGLKDRIKLLGYRNDVTKLLKKAKACIVASHYEAFGRITAEAMLLGCPVIGKASEGTLEIIKDERFGLLFNTEEELKNAMIYITEPANREKISMMINFSKERADLLFTQEELCKNILELYGNLKNK
jgi:glycosyltransferase involved in cell wall biosynthesis